MSSDDHQGMDGGWGCEGKVVKERGRRIEVGVAEVRMVGGGWDFFLATSSSFHLSETSCFWVGTAAASLRPDRLGTPRTTTSVYTCTLTVHAPSAMSVAGNTDGLHDVYEALDRYNWDDDVEFQSGLSAIIGTNSSPAQASELALRARCFYYAR